MPQNLTCKLKETYVEANETGMTVTVKGKLHFWETLILPFIFLWSVACPSSHDKIKHGKKIATMLRSKGMVHS